MDMWKILEIEPTDDMSAVMKAYARKLRLHHPEEDPVGYQRLREAFDQILNINKMLGQESEDGLPRSFSTQVAEVEEEDTIEVVPDTIMPPKKIWLDLDVYEPPDVTELNDLFVSQAEALYGDYFSRVNVENWKTLLKHEAVWNIGNRERLGIRMLHFFSDHHYIPQEVWQLLNHVFNWFDHEVTGNSYSEYSELLKYIQSQLQQENPPSFPCFNTDKPIEYDKFLELRENVKSAFEGNDLEKMERFIDEGEMIYDKDPDMLCLKSKLQLRKNSYREAVLTLTKLLEVKPNDEWASFYRFIAIYESSQKAQDYAQLSDACSCGSQKDQVAVSVANAYIEIGCFERAECWLQKAIKLKRSNLEEHYLLSKVYTAIQKRLMDELSHSPGSPVLIQQSNELSNKMRKNYRKIAKKREQDSYRIYRIMVLIFTAMMIILYCINLLVR